MSEDDSKWTKMMNKVGKLKGEERTFFEAVVKSLRIDEWLAKDNQKQIQETRVLTLGGGNTGKTTLLKQLQILYATGFSVDDKLGYRYSIYDNVLEGMLALVKSLGLLQLKLEPQFESYGEALQYFASTHHSSTSAKPLPHNFAPPVIEWDDDLFQFHVLPLVKTLWEFSDAIKQCFARKNELPLIIFDSTAYFFDNIDRIGLAGYVPTQQDVLQMRVKTLGVVEHKYSIKGLPWCFIDVAGQKTERRKWIHLFDGVSGVIFFVSLSSYDEFFEEGNDVNNDDDDDDDDNDEDGTNKPKKSSCLLVNEGLSLFEELMNNKLFNNVAFTVFLNKMDVFKSKIAKRPLKNFIPSYTGPDNDVQQSAEHIKQLFLSKNKLESRKVLVEFTCATDSSTIGQHIVNALEFIEEEKRRVDLHAASQSRLQSSSPSQLQPQSQTLNRSASSTSIPPASSSKPPGLTRNYSDLSDKSISFLINEFDAKTLSNTPVETVAEENSWAREGL